MKKITLLLLSVLTLTFNACKTDTPQEETTAGNNEPTKSSAVAPENAPVALQGVDDDIAMDSALAQVDSFKVVIKEQLKAKVELPPVYQREIFEANDEATDKLSKLSKACGGKMKVLVSSGEVVKELKETIKAISTNESDLLILMDRTGSMTDDIRYVKEGIRQIIDTIKKYKGTRLAVAIYGDKNWDWKGTWFTIRNFETNYDAAARYVDSVQVVGNMDWPESVYDAVVSGMESDFWKSTKKRNIILVGDAPPQEKPMSDYDLNGVIAKAKQLKVKMNFYPILIVPEIHKVVLSQEDKDKYKPIKNNTKLYPNPCAGVLNLSMENTATYYLEMYNTNGDAIISEQFYGITWSKDISNLPNGVYIMRVINEDHTFEVIKFILQH